MCAGSAAASLVIADFDQSKCCVICKLNETEKLSSYTSVGWFEAYQHPASEKKEEQPVPTGVIFPPRHYCVYRLFPQYHVCSEPAVTFSLITGLTGSEHGCRGGPHVWIIMWCMIKGKSVRVQVFGGSGKNPDSGYQGVVIHSEPW